MENQQDKVNSSHAAIEEDSFPTPGTSRAAAEDSFPTPGTSKAAVENSFPTPGTSKAAVENSFPTPGTSKAAAENSFPTPGTSKAAVENSFPTPGTSKAAADNSFPTPGTSKAAAASDKNNNSINKAQQVVNDHVQISPQPNFVPPPQPCCSLSLQLASSSSPTTYPLTTAATSSHVHNNKGNINSNGVVATAAREIQKQLQQKIPFIGPYPAFTPSGHVFIPECIKEQFREMLSPDWFKQSQELKFRQLSAEAAARRRAENGNKPENWREKIRAELRAKRSNWKNLTPIPSCAELQSSPSSSTNKAQEEASAAGTSSTSKTKLLTTSQEFFRVHDQLKSPPSLTRIGKNKPKRVGLHGQPPYPTVSETFFATLEALRKVPSMVIEVQKYTERIRGCGKKPNRNNKKNVYFDDTRTRDDCKIAPIEETAKPVMKSLQQSPPTSKSRRPRSCLHKSEPAKNSSRPRSCHHHKSKSVNNPCPSLESPSEEEQDEIPRKPEPWEIAFCPEVSYKYLNWMHPHLPPLRPVEPRKHYQRTPLNTFDVGTQTDRYHLPSPQESKIYLACGFESDYCSSRSLTPLSSNSQLQLALVRSVEETHAFPLPFASKIPIAKPAHQSQQQAKTTTKDMDGYESGYEYFEIPNDTPLKSAQNCQSRSKPARLGSRQPCKSDEMKMNQSENNATKSTIKSRTRVIRRHKRQKCKQNPELHKIMELGRSKKQAMLESFSPVKTNNPKKQNKSFDVMNADTAYWSSDYYWDEETPAQLDSIKSVGQDSKSPKVKPPITVTPTIYDDIVMNPLDDQHVDETTLKIYNVPEDITPEVYAKIFTMAEAVTAISYERVGPDHKYTIPVMYVMYNSKRQGAKALKEYNGLVFEGRTLAARYRTYIDKDPIFDSSSSDEDDK